MFGKYLTSNENIKNNRKTTKGFTLVELLVVISIISVLTGVLVIAINPVAILEKSRDGSRLQDLNALYDAIVLSLADGEIELTDTSGCADCDTVNGNQDLDGTGWVQFSIPTGMTGLTKFLSKLPLDPTNDATSNLIYVYASDGSDFEINCVLESPDNADVMSTDGGSDVNVYEVGTNLSVIT